jgi:hypothetical protein
VCVCVRVHGHGFARMQAWGAHAHGYVGACMSVHRGK